VRVPDETRRVRWTDRASHTVCAAPVLAPAGTD
jgi:hypothetical protein